MQTTNTATTTKTQRRTTKITQPARGYVAIKVDYVSAATTRIACVAKVAMHIEGTNGASVTLKAGEAFHLVRSESLGPNMFYIVREEVGVKKCSCPANKPCKHEVALAAHIAEHGRSPLHLRARAQAAEDAKFKAEFAARVADYAEQQEAGKAKQAEELAAKRRDLVACAAANAAQAGDAVDKALMASTAASVKRTSAPLAYVGFSLYR